MPVSEAQKRATIKYMKNNYDDIKVRVPKGSKERWKSIAENNGVSLRQLIISSVEEKIKNLEK